jgi:hypothetical protein
MNPSSGQIKLAVIGSRSFADKDLLFQVMDRNRHRIQLIVSGGAKGADALAQEWAHSRGVPCQVFHPKWQDEHGRFDRSAGFKRNVDVIRNADEVLAFWDGQSPGTKHAIELARKRSKAVQIANFSLESKRCALSPDL